MADDDQDKAREEGKPEPNQPVSESVASEQPKVADPPPPESTTSRTSQSEWTVSDRRGPLDSAQDEADVERFVPEHETDAVGVEDHGSSGAEETVAEETSAPSASHGEFEVSPAMPSAVTEHAEPEPRSNEPISVASSPAAAPAEPSPAPGSTRRSAWPIAAGLIGGCVLGAAIAALIFASQGSGEGSEGQVQALTSRVADLEKRPDLQQSLGPLQASLANLGHRVMILEQNAAQPTGSARPPAVSAQRNSAQPVPSQPTASSQSVGNSGGSSAPALGPLQQKISDLTAAFSKLQDRTKGLESQAAESKDLAGKLSSLETAVSGAQKEASTAQSSVAAVEVQQKSLEGKVGTPAQAVVADSLVQQIDHGEPFVTQVDALASLGADPAKLAVLKDYADKGVPSAANLAAKFAPLAEPMVAAMHQAPPNAGLLDRLKSGMAGLVTVRRTDLSTGNDVPSRVSQIETSLAHGDVTEAYETWNLLPAEAKAKSEAWGALAKTSAVAGAAARSLQRESIISLSAKKS